MKKSTKLLAASLITLLMSAPGLAKEYSLANGKVQFDAPEAWPAMMEKTNGDPQFYAFQIRNPDSPGTLTRITVTTHELAEVTDFDAYRTQTIAKTRHSTGFSEAADELPTDHSLHYYFNEDGHPQIVRMSLFQHGHHAIMLRCQRPKDAKASSQWLVDYHAGCEDLARQLGN